MGDRANILVTGEGSSVYLYTHWAGTFLPETLERALARSQDRWDDVQYLTRVIFSQMLIDDSADALTATTGYGISSRLGDGSERVLVVNVDRQIIYTLSADAVEVPFAEFKASLLPDF
jgi:hypothetical protein